MKAALLTLVAGIVFLLDPAFSLGSGRHFEFGESEIRTALAGTWTVKLEHHAPLELHIEMKQVQRKPTTGFVRDAGACGSRTLIRSADACVDLTRVPLRVVVENHPKMVATGELAVLGLAWRVGQLDLEVDGVQVRATIAIDGRVVHGGDVVTHHL